MTRRFELTDARSSKFWEVTYDGGTSFEVRFGRIGTKGQSQTRTHSTNHIAKLIHDALIREKLAKGYVERGPGAVAAAPRTVPVPRVETVVVDLEDGPPHLEWRDESLGAADPRRGYESARRPLPPVDEAVVSKPVDEDQLPDPDLHEAWTAACRPLAVDPQTWDVDVEALRYSSRDFHGWQMYMPPTRGADPLVQGWAVRRSPEFALRALVRSWSIFVTDDNRLVRQAPSSPLFEAGDVQGWRSLRHCLAVCPDADYAEARAAGAEMRGQAPLPLRCALSYAFPLEEAWSIEDAQACLDLSPFPHSGWCLLASITDASLARRLAHGVAEENRRYLSELIQPGRMKSHPPMVGPFIYSLLEGVGPEAVAFLEDMAHGLQLARALDVVVSLPAAERLVAFLEDKESRNVATGFFRRHPAVGLRALLAPAAQSSSAGARCSELALDLLSEHASLAERVRPRLEAAAEANLNRLLAILNQPPEAPAEALPPVLRALPKKTARPAPAPPVEVERLAFEESVEWPAGRRERAAASPYLQWFLRPVGADASDEQVLLAWNTHTTQFRHAFEDAVEGLLARYGLDSLPGVLAYWTTNKAATMRALRHIRSPRLAPLMADAYLRLKSMRRDAEQWLRIMRRPPSSAWCRTRSDGPANPARPPKLHSDSWIAGATERL